MQTDTWLTDTSHLDCCPLCSQPLAGGSNTCPSCGFTAHEPARNLAASPDTPPSSSKQRHPATPIPARASALHAQNPPGGAPRRSTLSQLPGSFSPVPAERVRSWQHESSNYEVASSLSALSLLISETPTAPPRTTRRLQHQTEWLEHIDEIDTLPPTLSSDQVVSVKPSKALLPPDSLLLRLDDIALPKQPAALSEVSHPILLSSIDEIDTLPEPVGVPSKAAQPMRSKTREVAVDMASWRASFNSTGSWHSRFFVSRPPLRQPRQRFTLLDRVRWWLVRPGHIEFLLWLFGSILLFGLIFLLLLVTVLSLQSTSSGNLLSSLFARLIHLNPLIWVIVFCYLLSMFFMGLAGVLRRRR